MIQTIEIPTLTHTAFVLYLSKHNYLCITELVFKQNREMLLSIEDFKLIYNTLAIYHPTQLKFENSTNAMYYIGYYLNKFIECQKFSQYSKDVFDDVFKQKLMEIALFV